MSKLTNRGPKPIPEEDRKKVYTLSFKTDVWDKAQDQAKKKGFTYRGRVSVSAYLEDLINKDK